MSIAHDLAAALEGDVRADSLIIIRDGDRVSVIDCRPTGRVLLNGDHMLGWFSDGVDVLAARFRDVMAEVSC